MRLDFKSWADASENYRPRSQIIAQNVDLKKKGVFANIKNRSIYLKAATVALYETITSLVKLILFAPIIKINWQRTPNVNRWAQAGYNNYLKSQLSMKAYFLGAILYPERVKTYRDENDPKAQAKMFLFDVPKENVTPKQEFKKTSTQHQLMNIDYNHFKMSASTKKVLPPISEVDQTQSVSGAYARFYGSKVYT